MSQHLLTIAQNIGTAVVSAALYSIVFYVKQKESVDPEDFNFYKFGATIIVGAGIGIILYITGIDVTHANIQTQLVAYAGTIAIVESLLKAAYRKFKVATS